MENMRKLRKSKRVTQFQLSLVAEVAQETISGYERGKIMPSVETLGKIAAYLETSTDYLLDRTDVALPIDALVQQRYSDEETEMIQVYRDLTPEMQNRMRGYLAALRDSKAAK